MNGSGIGSQLRVFGLQNRLVKGVGTYATEFLPKSVKFKDTDCEPLDTPYCFIVLDDIISLAMPRTVGETGKRILTIRGFLQFAP